MDKFMHRVHSPNRGKKVIYMAENSPRLSEKKDG
jgi:hypothetical protein